MTHSLDRLTDGERGILRLLAQGHTAKTIARTQGLSVNAVNERLRSARRKTDASSSRGLARLIVDQERKGSQENRDNFIGLERSHTLPQSVGIQGIAVGARVALTKWRMIVILGILIAAGLLAYQISFPVQAVPPSQTRSLAEQVPELEGLQARFQTESPDTLWASRAEDRLRAAYRGIHIDIKALNCGSTLCEAVGSMSRPIAEQTLAIPSMAARLGSPDGEGGNALKLLRSEANLVRSNAEPASEQDQFGFTAYWQRID